jgi:hypothetical protein
MLLDRPLVVVDIGCRLGFAEKWKVLGSQVRLIGFDADAAECQVLSEILMTEPINVLRKHPIGVAHPCDFCAEPIVPSRYAR